MQYNYARKYIIYLDNPSMILTLPNTIRSNVLKAMICLSKYLGQYSEYKSKLKQHGVTWLRTDNFASFINIMNNSHSDLIQWYNKAIGILEDPEKLYLRFMLLSGLRKAEGLESFNMIISLSQQNKLNEYYNEELSMLQHYKYGKIFLRGTKNVYISFVDRNLILQISNSKPLTYEQIRKRLIRNGLKIRLQELRQYYASYMAKHGLISEEVDLVQGRISKSVFAKAYLKENPKELSDRTLSIVKDLEKSIIL